MERTTRPNPVFAARRVLRRLLRQGVTPDWSLVLVARYPTERPDAWTDEERRRWFAAWALLGPPETV